MPPHTFVMGKLLRLILENKATLYIIHTSHKNDEGLTIVEVRYCGLKFIERFKAEDYENITPWIEKCLNAKYPDDIKFPEVVPPLKKSKKKEVKTEGNLL